MSLVAQRAMATLLEQHAFEGRTGQWVIARNKVQSFFSEFGFQKHLVQRIFKLTPEMEDELPGVINVNVLRHACESVLGLQLRLPTLVIEDGDEPGQSSGGAIPICGDVSSQPVSDGCVVVEASSSTEPPLWNRILELDDGVNASMSDGIDVPGIMSSNAAAATIPSRSTSPSSLSCLSGLNRGLQHSNSNNFDDMQSQASQSSSGVQRVWKPGDGYTLVVASTEQDFLKQKGQKLSVTKQYNKDELMLAEKHELVKHVLNLQKQGVRKQGTLRVLRNHGKQKDRALKRISNKLVAISDSTEHVDESFTLRKRGKGVDGRGGRLSLNNIFSIGLRRSCTSIAAADFAIVSMVEVSAQTVLRCELRTAAAICQSMRLFVSFALDSCFEQHRTGQWSLMAIGIRADATNSSVWRRSKLHVVEATVMYISNFKALSAGDFAGSISSRRCVQLSCAISSVRFWGFFHWSIF